MKVEYQIFPKEVIEEQFNTILKTCSAELDPKEIMEKIHSILVNRIILVNTYKDSDEALTLWRITKPYEGFKEENKACYINPPSIDKLGNKCSRQRANIEGNPVMYTAIDPLTSITEMKGSLGLNMRFFVSRWKLEFNRPVMLHQMVFNSHTNKDGNVLKEYSYNQELKLRKPLEGIPLNLQEGYIYSILKMGDLFAIPSTEQYHITSAYAHDVLYTIREQNVFIDGITYPSIENNHSSLNIAWHPDIINSGCLALEEVFECQIIEDNLKNEDQSVSISIFRKGTFINDIFSHWESPFLKILEIQWTELQLRTFNGFVLKGIEALETIILERDISVQLFLEEHIFSVAFQELLNEYSNSKPKQQMLSTLQIIFEQIVVLKAEHGNRIITPAGIQCIEIFMIPIKWEKSYKAIK